MRIVIQRVSESQVTVDNQVVGRIGQGFLVLLGIHKDDQPSQTSWLVQKLVNMRVFADAAGKMNLSLKDVSGQVLVVSQFTLYGNALSGRRPDFIDAASPTIAEPIYKKFVNEVAAELGEVQTGQFGALMQVSLVNDGPITLILDAPAPSPKSV